MRIVIALAVLTGAVGMPRSAHACICDSGGPPCQATWAADAVFAARVLTIDAAVGEPNAKYPQSRRVRVRVIEAFRNIAVNEVDVFTGSGGGDCGYRFEVGSDYLIYAYSSSQSGRLGTSSCHRTRRLADAAEDLRYLRGAAREAATGRGRLFGSVRRMDRVEEGAWSAREPLANLLVTAISGDRTHRARTGVDGSFEMAVLAGQYQVTANLPDELHMFGPATAEVRDLRGCAEVRLIAYWNGRVSGRVLTAAGEPVPSFAVEVIPVAMLQGEIVFPDFKTRTDAQGRYTIARISPGTYHLGSDTWRMGPNQPEGARLLLKDETGAPRVVEVPNGHHLEAADFVLPEGVRLAEVSGVVVNPNGAPAVGARVYVRSDTDRADFPAAVVTGADGRFSLTVIAGRRYRVSADGYATGRYSSHAELRGIDAARDVKGLVLELKPLR